MRPRRARSGSAYIAHNIEFTRLAYKLDGVTLASSRHRDLTAEDIAANEETVSNVRLWDPSVIRSTYANVQELRAYYNLPDVDVDRYMLDGRLTQLMVAAATSTKRPSRRTAAAQRLEYPTGMGW